MPAYELEKRDAAGGCDNYRGGGDHEDAEIRRKVALAAAAAVLGSKADNSDVRRNVRRCMCFSLSWYATTAIDSISLTLPTAIAAIDMFVVATATFPLLNALIVLGHDRRNHPFRGHPKS